MKKHLIIILLSLSTYSFSQINVIDSVQTTVYQQNIAQRILSGNINSKGVTIGGYAEVTYNRASEKNAELDVQRLVILVGYKFDERTQFITEIEFEHVKEVYVEQAFLQYGLSDNLNVRAGLMLVPMGIVNEYHEPNTFNGVERPSMDGAIVPTTWREIGIGIAGRHDDVSLRYQAYLFNGFQSTSSDGSGNVTAGLIGGSKGLRGGRQKGAKSTFNSVNVSAKVDYYGIQGLRLGLAGYFGRTQSPVDVADIDGADIGISMIGLDARYQYQRFSARGQYVNASLSDTEAYNLLTGKDLGSALSGYYIETAYNLLPIAKKQQLVGFVRYEDYDSHSSVPNGLVKNNGYDRNEWTLGLTYMIARGAVVKADYQIKENALAGVENTKQLNFGIGVQF